MRKLSFLYAGCDIFHGCTVRHAHRGWEFLYILDGVCNVYFDNVKFEECAPGNIFIIPPHAAHERVNLSRTETRFAVFEADVLEWETPQCLNTGKDRLLENWLNDMAELHKSNLPRQAESILSAVIQRIRYLVPKVDSTVQLHPAFLRACRFMAEHYGKNLTIADVAEAAAVSQSHLNLLFRRFSGASPLHYLRKVRMQAARQLLLNPYSSISEVAEACGFEDMHYFTRIFTKSHGIPPGKFRSDPAQYADIAKSFDV